MSNYIIFTPSILLGYCLLDQTASLLLWGLTAAEILIWELNSQGCCVDVRLFCLCVLIKEAKALGRPLQVHCGLLLDDSWVMVYLLLSPTKSLCFPPLFLDIYLLKGWKQYTVKHESRSGWNKFKALLKEMFRFIVFYKLALNLIFILWLYDATRQ